MCHPKTELMPKIIPDPEMRGLGKGRLGGGKKRKKGKGKGNDPGQRREKTTRKGKKNERIKSLSPREPTVSRKNRGSL